MPFSAALFNLAFTQLITSNAVQYFLRYFLLVFVLISR